MQLLPLVEMYCRWDLQEDCSNLQALVQRFDSVSELESHDLGRSLLRMVRDEEDGLLAYSERRHVEPFPHLGTDPFGAVRARLASVDLAFQSLQAQVLIFVGYNIKCALGNEKNLRFGWHFDANHSNSVISVGVRQFCPHVSIQIRFGGRFLDFLCAHLCFLCFRVLCFCVLVLCYCIGLSSVKRLFLHGVLDFVTAES